MLVNNLPKRIPVKRKTAQQADAPGIRPALQQRSQDKRDRLIKAGITMFAVKGYEMTRMGDIADEAGVSVGVLYQRFKDKRALFDAIETEELVRARKKWALFFQRADPDWTIYELMESLFAGIAQTHRKELGFFQTYITLGFHDKSVVEPGIAIDVSNAEDLEAYLIEHQLVAEKKLRKNQIYFALTTVNKTLLSLASTGGGPYKATDRQAAKEFALMFCRYLDLD